MLTAIAVRGASITRLLLQEPSSLGHSCCAHTVGGNASVGHSSCCRIPQLQQEALWLLAGAAGAQGAAPLLWVISLVGLVAVVALCCGQRAAAGSLALPAASTTLLLLAVLSECSYCSCCRRHRAAGSRTRPAL